MNSSISTWLPCVSSCIFMGGRHKNKSHKWGKRGCSLTDLGCTLIRKNALYCRHLAKAWENILYFAFWWVYRQKKPIRQVWVENSIASHLLGLIRTDDHFLWLAKVHFDCTSSGGFMTFIKYVLFLTCPAPNIILTFGVTLQTEVWTQFSQ